MAACCTARELALTFSSLRANDLIWNYVVNNYLKGGKPDAFDLLYWNSDSTNLPGAMFVYYLRNTYLENNLRVPGKLTMCGVPVDLSRVDDAGLHPRHARRPHRAVENRLSEHAAAGRRDQIRAGGERPYRGRRQSGRQKPPQLLDLQRDCRRTPDEWLAGGGSRSRAAGGPTGAPGSPSTAAQRPGARPLGSEPIRPSSRRPGVTCRKRCAIEPSSRRCARLRVRLWFCFLSRRT